jgi:hypothetical protein
VHGSCGGRVAGCGSGHDVAHGCRDVGPCTGGVVRRDRIDRAGYGRGALERAVRRRSWCAWLAAGWPYRMPTRT